MTDPVSSLKTLADMLIALVDRRSARKAKSYTAFADYLDGIAACLSSISASVGPDGRLTANAYDKCGELSGYANGFRPLAAEWLEPSELDAADSALKRGTMARALMSRLSAATPTELAHALEQISSSAGRLRAVAAHMRLSAAR